MPFYDYKCEKCGYVMEICHSITLEGKPDIVCSECQNKYFTKVISCPHGVIIKNLEMNQYKDVLSSRYWRDKNGVRHKVTPGDGHSGSTTVNRQTVSPEVAKARKKRDRAQGKTNRIKGSYQRFSRRVKK